MSKGTIITCAVTGSLTRPEDNGNLPVTPEQIAVSALEAADAGAAILHLHVRHPDGRPSMELDHYRELVRLIRVKNTEVILNITTGPGGRFQPGEEDPKIAGPRTNFVTAERRVEHIRDLRPDVCTLDLNTMTFGSEIVINTPPYVKKMAEIIYDCGVRPEFELFDSGDISLLNDFLASGVFRGPPLASLVLGVKYGFTTRPETMMFARNMLPHDAIWTGFGIGRAAYPMLLQSYLLGGHVRIGMEDTVRMSRTELVKSNAELVEKAKWLLESVGATVASPEWARSKLRLGS
ncbi:3-keto-5-aminohexanoate cleavage protein [Allomesorhizobium camelthorni]|uniref:3-keto-5-aminohexanoate cleavage protein n=1 Tax=Allomesorhizobium camelthorni TaxID=475069 RepID=A0A6G4WHM0_9HYPH|nr:3-keto-5-aminohexanoate cleavage protein [Mesorhizobium camelthorni]NGO53716.1 3-keto-5-aminohexanoate cleavage protein [Mesorhizobium camelthorni]